MSNRVYQIIALAFLIGAPVVVQIVSSALPGAQQAAQAAGETRHADDGPTPAATPSTMPASQPRQGDQPSPADPLVDVTPSLDPQGISPEAAGNPAEFAAAPPPPAPPPPPHQPARSADDDVGPPPPRRPAYMDR